MIGHLFCIKSHIFCGDYKIMQKFKITQKYLYDMFINKDYNIFIIFITY